MILHPHWGYLCKFTRKNFTLNEIIEFYQYEFLSGHFRRLGRVFLYKIFKLFDDNIFFFFIYMKDILANRVTALNLWNILDKDKKGFLDFKTFLRLLEVKIF